MARLEKLSRLRPALTALALAGAVLAAATAATGAAVDAAAGETHPQCIHDEIAKIQTAGATLSALRQQGHFNAAGVVEAPQACTTSDPYKPLRIAVYTEDLYNSSKYCSEVGQTRPTFRGFDATCTSQDILTPEKRSILINTMIPAAIKMHEERLSVVPFSLLTLGNSMSGSVCGSFSPPASVIQDGIRNADFALFVGTGVMSASAAAWATTCGYTPDHIPIIGAIHVMARYIDGSDQSIRTMAHEIAHALGFNGDFFKHLGLTVTLSGIRGRPSTPVINTDSVVQRVGNQFGCNVSYGMELDDTSGPGTAGSHWAPSISKDDLMGGYSGPVKRYSAITLAAFESTGIYKVNYDKAEHMEWGFQAGCAVQTKKCVIDGVSQVPGMFCDDTSLMTAGACSVDRTGVSVCNAAPYPSSIPSYFQYFSDPTIGGNDFDDYCPFDEVYPDFGCRSATLSTMWYSIFSATSKCIDFAKGGALLRGICAEFTCDASTKTYKVLLAGASSAASCPEGSTINAEKYSSAFPAGSTLICPPYRSVCPTTFNSLAIKVKRIGDDGAAQLSETHALDTSCDTPDSALSKASGAVAVAMLCVTLVAALAF